MVSLLRNVYPLRAPTDFLFREIDCHDDKLGKWVKFNDNKGEQFYEAFIKYF